MHAPAAPRPTPLRRHWHSATRRPCNATASQIWEGRYTALGAGLAQHSSAPAVPCGANFTHTNTHGRGARLCTAELLH